MKPSLAKGTRDFSTLETYRRRYIFDTIRTVFELYGYQAIETPAMENLSTLTGKYGEEGDRLIFKILNSGDFTEQLRKESIDLNDTKRILPFISDKALRYDLTVPFARYVAMNRNNLAFPFKRFQIQPVWRADRPQKGRYREFWQCDADVVGSSSMLNEAELIQVYDRVFSQLGLPVKILINNRKILTGIAEVIEAPEFLIDITVALDKLEKIGPENVEAEMIQKGIPENAIKKLRPLFAFRGDTKQNMEFLKAFLSDSPNGQQGINELEILLSYFQGNEALKLKTTEISLDLTLARGLNYYTGTILEVKAKNIQFGSIGGGGRYDDLTGIFGFPGMPGVGISFGADRIYDVLLELNLFPDSTIAGTEILIANFSAEDERAALPILQKLRSSGIKTELYPEPAKLKKQFEYAEKKEIPFLLIYGENERNSNQVQIKKLATGIQMTIPLNELESYKTLFQNQ